jgi:putative molybdopterin biosynthesis protein
MLVLVLAEREQGLLAAPGNPLGLRGVEDLERRQVRLANRQRGSGTRLWLDRRLHSLGIAPEAVSGYAQACQTHTEVARLIQQGQADCGIALRAAAAQADLHFIPLFQERYDLVLPLANARLPALQPLLERLASFEFRQYAAALGGYETTHSGEVRS